MNKIQTLYRAVLALAVTALTFLFVAPVFSQDTTEAGRSEFEDSQVYRREIIVFGQDVVLKQNEISREIVVVGGDLIIEGTAESDVVVVFGSVTLKGKAERDMVVVFGSADLTEGAEIDGDAVIVGGKLNIEPGASLHGGRTEFVFGETIPDLSWVGDWFLKGVLLARPIPPQFIWAWAVAAVLALTYLVLAAVFPRPVSSCVHALETTPAASLFAGLLGIVLVGPLIFLLLISVAGILVIPVLFFALVAAVLLGKIAVYQCAGAQLGRQLNVGSLQKPVVALFVGITIFFLVYTVPVLGFLVWGLTLAWGLGAVFVAIYSKFQREHNEEPAFVTTPAALTGDQVMVESTSPPADPPELADSISLERAGFWVRLWASLLDAVLLGILMAFTGPLFFLLWAGYHIAMWMWKGTTIGGIVAGIKVLRVDGQPMSFSVAFVRSLSSFFSAVVLFFGFFWAGWDKEKQSWHDKIAGTIVVKVPKGMSLL